jgi:hypothetical protein
MSIDLDTVKSAYDFLADKPEGHKALADFKGALDSLGEALSPQLNRAEFLYLARGLLRNMRVEDGDSGELSDDQLSAVAGGMTSSYFMGSIVRLGDTRVMGNLGFRIDIAI